MTQYCATSDLTDWIDFTTDATVDTTLLGDIITRASAIIDSYCGRTFAVPASTDITTDKTTDAFVASDLVTTTVRYFDAVTDIWGQRLMLDKDLAYLVSISNDGTAVTTDQYVTEPRNDLPIYAIKLLNSSGVTWTYSTDPENAISVTGWWSYDTSIPDPIIHACMRLSQWLYKQRSSDSVSDQPMVLASGMTIMPAKLPADVISMLEPYRRIRIGTA